MPSLIERLQAKADWFNGKWKLDDPDNKRPPYEPTITLLMETIAELQRLQPS